MDVEIEVVGCGAAKIGARGYSGTKKILTGTFYKFAKYDSDGIPHIIDVADIKTKNGKIIKKMVGLRLRDYNSVKYFKEGDVIQFVAWVDAQRKINFPQNFKLICKFD